MKSRTLIYLAIGVVIVYFLWRSSQSTSSTLPAGTLPAAGGGSLWGLIPTITLSTSPSSNLYGGPGSSTVAYGGPADDDTGNDD